MSLEIDYHPLARSDLYRAWSWYEDRRSGLGDRFAAAIDDALDQVAAWPQSGSPETVAGGEVIERSVRAVDFPYVVRYRVVGNLVVVMAIHHERRHPGFGSERAL